MLRDEDNHDQRYEDGDESTGTVTDFTEDWAGDPDLALDGPYADDWAKREGLAQMREQGY